MTTAAEIRAMIRNLRWELAHVKRVIAAAERIQAAQERRNALDKKAS